jgi:CRP/FNR family transcriptional regulator
MRGQRVETRIAQLFLLFAERLGHPIPDGIEIPIALTRQEIAELVGTTVESAIRVMSRWNRDGVITTGERRFVIPDLERLRQTVEGGAAAEEP